MKDVNTLELKKESTFMAHVARKVHSTNKFLSKELKAKITDSYVEIRSSDINQVKDNPKILFIEVLDVNNQSDLRTYSRNEFLDAPQSSKKPFISKHDGKPYTLHALGW